MTSGNTSTSERVTLLNTDLAGALRSEFSANISIAVWLVCKKSSGWVRKRRPRSWNRNTECSTAWQRPWPLFSGASCSR